MNTEPDGKFQDFPRHPMLSLTCPPEVIELIDFFNILKNTLNIIFKFHSSGLVIIKEFYGLVLVYSDHYLPTFLNVFVLIKTSSFTVIIISSLLIIRFFSPYKMNVNFRRVYFYYVSVDFIAVAACSIF